MVQHPAPVVGDDDAPGPGLQGLFRPLHCHNPLDDEGQTGVLGHLPEGLHTLGAGVAPLGRQKGQAGGIHIHGDGGRVRGPGLFHLFQHRLHPPGLDGGHPQTAPLLHPFQGQLQQLRIHPIPGEGQHPGVSAAVHHRLGPGGLVHGGGVIVGHAADGSGEDRGGKPPAPKRSGAVLALVVIENVQIQGNLPELFHIADKGSAGALPPGSGDLPPAGPAVAFPAHPAPGRQIFLCVFQYLLIGHVDSSLLF